MKKETIKRQGSMSSISFAQLFIILCIALPIILCLYYFYYDFQISIFSNNNTLLFIHDNLSKIIIVSSPFIILFCISFNIQSDTSIRIMKIRIYLFISIVIFIISSFILVCQFFECVDINKEGIYARNGIFSANKNYMWSDVTYAEVSYERGYKNEIDIIYNIHLNDGTIVNACNTKDFFGNITNLDNFMKDKEIKIIRSNIKPSDYSDFTKRYKGDRMQVILEILNK